MSDQGQGHYSTVVRSMAEGRVVPLLGAGVNLASRPRGKAWKQGQYLPNGYELAKYLAGIFYFPEETDLNLLRVSQYVVAKEGLGPLYDELRKLFNENYPATPVHEFFAALPGKLRKQGTPQYQVILTTNYDDALERAFDKAGEPYDVIWYIADREPRGKFWHRPPGAAEPNVIDRPNAYDGLAIDERTVILKIHGAVDRSNPERDSYVITEDHYIDYLTKTDVGQLIPAELLVKLTRSRFLFLGYSMQDWNLRVILHRIWGQQPLSYKSWAIQRDPNEIEQELWEARGVDVFDIPLAEVRHGAHRGARAPLDERLGFRRLVTVKAPPRPRVVVPATPYVGLTPFTEGDAPFFFGREKERRIISANLLASRLTLLYGASGVGKSSIIRAGVQRDFRTRAEKALASGLFPESIVVVFTGWRDDPVTGLAECIANSVQELLGELAPRPPRRKLRLDDLLVEWNRLLDKKALEHAGARADLDEPIRTELLVIFDQFEQYFVYHGDEDGPDTFAIQFPQAVNRDDLRASFLISLREDAYTQLDRFEGRILNLFASNLRIEHLDEKAATAAIVKPVETYNELLGNGDPPFEVEPELVEAVIREVRAGNIVLGQAGGGVVEH